jgi:DNA repair protein RecO (recombination protein O)
MRVEGQPALILHVRPWRETSLLVEALSRDHGRIGLVARGVRGGKKHVQRAALHPLQHVRLDYRPGGELASLHQTEAIDAAPRLDGERALAGLYVHELVLRLLPRQDPHPELYLRLLELREQLAGTPRLAWELRRFERDLLDLLGFCPRLDEDGEGRALEPDARYRLDAEHGLQAVAGGRNADALSGADWLAYAQDRCPPEAALPALRRAMREAIAAHLGGRGLSSWELMPELTRVMGR